MSSCGLVAPRPHRDIDLLYPAPDFAAVDELLASGAVDEIVAKRFPHKRAFELDGVMTELFLVRNDPAGHYTDFWGDQRYDWPNDVFGHVDGVPVTSAAALTGFRTKSHGFTPTLDGVPVPLEEWTRHHVGDELGS